MSTGEADRSLEASSFTTQWRSNKGNPTDSSNSASSFNNSTDERRNWGASMMLCAVGSAAILLIRERLKVEADL